MSKKETARKNRVWTEKDTKFITENYASLGRTTYATAGKAGPDPASREALDGRRAANAGTERQRGTQHPAYAASGPNRRGNLRQKVRAGTTRHSHAEKAGISVAQKVRQAKIPETVQ